MLIGNEWFVYVTSREVGEKVLQVKAGSIDLGQLKMVFGAEVKKEEESKLTEPVPAKNPQKNYLIWYVSGGTIVLLIAVGIFFYIRYKK